MAADPCQIQQFIHQQAHLLCPCLNAIEVVLSARIECRAEFFHEHLGKAADMPQGRPQVMRHRVTESFELLVRGFQLGRPLYHSLLEFIIEFSDLSLIRSTPSDVAESHYSAMHHAVLVFQGTTAGLDPCALREFAIAHKYLGGANLP